jgi:hypothetical protein
MTEMPRIMLVVGSAVNARVGWPSVPESIFAMILEHVVLPVIAGRETEFLAAFARG